MELALFYTALVKNEGAFVGGSHHPRPSGEGIGDDGNLNMTQRQKIYSINGGF